MTSLLADFKQGELCWLHLYSISSFMVHCRYSRLHQLVQGWQMLLTSTDKSPDKQFLTRHHLHRCHFSSNPQRGGNQFQKESFVHSNLRYGSRQERWFPFCACSAFVTLCRPKFALIQGHNTDYSFRFHHLFHAKAFARHFCGPSCANLWYISKTPR